MLVGPLYLSDRVALPLDIGSDRPQEEDAPAPNGEVEEHDNGGDNWYEYNEEILGYEEGGTLQNGDGKLNGPHVAAGG